MKVIFPNRSFAATAAVLALLGGLTASPAQPRSEGGARPAARQPERAGPAGGLPVERILNEEQRRSFRELMLDQREKLRDLAEESRRARRALMEASLGEGNREAVKEAAGRLAKLEAEMAMQRAESLARIQPPLSPEQKERLRELVNRMGERAGELRERLREGRRPEPERGRNPRESPREGPRREGDRDRLDRGGPRDNRGPEAGRFAPGPQSWREGQRPGPGAGRFGWGLGPGPGQRWQAPGLGRFGPGLGPWRQGPAPQGRGEFAPPAQRLFRPEAGRPPGLRGRNPPEERHPDPQEAPEPGARPLRRR